MRRVERERVLIVVVQSLHETFRSEYLGSLTEIYHNFFVQRYSSLHEVIYNSTQFLVKLLEVATQEGFVNRVKR